MWGVCIQTNHLGHFVIATQAASEHLNKASKGKLQRPLRVVCLSSVAARSGRMKWDDLQVSFCLCRVISRLTCSLAPPILHQHVHEHEHARAFAVK